jgi:Ca2+/H+ antiporter, TMEM165/GDT1 family
VRRYGWPIVDLLIAALPAFLASLVEFVEALTIVLAVGLTRGWRPSIAGAGAAGFALVTAVAAFGPSLSRIDPDYFKAAIGSLLLLFGLRWLRKALLRYAGVLAQRDEEEKYRSSERKILLLPQGSGFDWAGAAVSFKATLLEGLEVLFIVLALGAKGGHALASASLGAALAFVAVVAVGAAVRHPLSRVPENTLKFLVGGMLCSFGTFWAGEGLGVDWPGGDVSIVVLLALTAGLSAAAVRVLRGSVRAVDRLAA